MSHSTHPYLKTLYMSALVFGATILIIVFTALYVHSKVSSVPDLPPAKVEKNLTPTGKLYPRQ